MKTCPRCQAVLFADMMTCFGCMFRFEETPDYDEDFLNIVDDSDDCIAQNGAVSLTLPPVAAPCSPELRLCAEAGPSEPAGLSQGLDSACGQDGGWLIRLELKNMENPQQVWSMELTPSRWGSLEVA